MRSFPGVVNSDCIKGEENEEENPLRLFVTIVNSSPQWVKTSKKCLCVTVCKVQWL